MSYPPRFLSIYPIQSKIDTEVALAEWNGELDQKLTTMVYDYGSQISDFGDLPHDLKMHSKEKLAQRMISNPTEGDIFVPENYDKSTINGRYY